MSQHTFLAPFDRHYVEKLVEQVYPKVYGRQGRKALKVVLTEGVEKIILRAAERGDVQAERIVGGLRLDGMYARVESYLPAMDTTRISHAGHVLSMPTHIGVAQRAQNGRRKRRPQQRLWFEVTWDQFVEWLEGQRVLAASMSAKVAILDVILTLRDRHPDTKTPGEACEREGLDPRILLMD